MAGLRPQHVAGSAFGENRESRKVDPTDAIALRFASSSASSSRVMMMLMSFPEPSKQLRPSDPRR